MNDFARFPESAPLHFATANGSTNVVENLLVGSKDQRLYCKPLDVPIKKWLHVKQLIHHAFILYHSHTSSVLPKENQQPAVPETLSTASTSAQ